MVRLKDFEFTQLNLTSFLNDLIGHAKETIHMFSKFLADEAKTKLFELRDKLDVNPFVFCKLQKGNFLFRNMKIILNDQLIHWKI
jgi:hypothetical protein